MSLAEIARKWTLILLSTGVPLRGLLTRTNLTCRPVRRGRSRGTGRGVPQVGRQSPKARRSGTFEEVRSELADLLIVTAVFAAAGYRYRCGCQAKLEIIYSRGWKEVEECKA